LKQAATKPVEEYLNQDSDFINPMNTVVADTLDTAANRWTLSIPYTIKLNVESGLI
jgi:hypothetical protein